MGIIISSSDLAWSNHIKGIVLKARKQIGLLYRRFYKHAHQDTLRALYVALIQPHELRIWSACVRPRDIDVLEAVQREPMHLYTSYKVICYVYHQETIGIFCTDKCLTIIIINIFIREIIYKRTLISACMHGGRHLFTMCMVLANSGSTATVTATSSSQQQDMQLLNSDNSTHASSLITSHE